MQDRTKEVAMRKDAVTSCQCHHQGAPNPCAERSVVALAINLTAVASGVWIGRDHIYPKNCDAGDAQTSTASRLRCDALGTCVADRVARVLLVPFETVRPMLDRLRPRPGSYYIEAQYLFSEFAFDNHQGFDGTRA
jgi:hypothetical protein